MFVIRFSRLINRNLIGVFDQSRLLYMFLLFPAYQFFAFIGIAAITFSLLEIETAFYFAPLALMLIIFIGVPILASWYLSFLLFATGYFEFFSKLGVPLMPWMTRQLEGAVQWFRPESI